MAAGIKVRDLVVRRGTFRLEVPSLEVKPREVFAILGSTGSGKTVLMESIAGAFPLDEGQILLDGKDIETLPVQQRHLGIVYQDFALFPHMTVFDNVAYGLKMNGCPKCELAGRVEEMLELFSISHIAQRYPGVISGGEGQRTALARALVLQPEVLLLDEPFSALDPATKNRMYGMLRDVHRRFDCTIVFVTHDFNEAAVLADRVGIVLDGSLRTVTRPECLNEGQFDQEIMYFLGR